MSMPTLTALEYMGGNIENLKTIALLIEKASGQVVNANKNQVYSEGGISEDTGLASIHRKTGFSSYGGKGHIFVTVREKMKIAIHSLSGQLIITESASPDETICISLPAGIYIVNGQKVLVR